MKKLFLLLLLTLLPLFAHGQTQLSTDSFTYSNGTLLSVSGGNWTQSGGTSDTSVSISSNAISTTSSPFVAFRWTGTGTYTADQYSAITATGVNASTRWLGAGVRIASSTTSGTFGGYFLSCSSTNCKLEKYVNGSVTTLQAATAHGLSINGKVIRLSVTGSTLTPLVNGATPAGFSATYTDSSLANGSVGFDVQSSITADNWEGGLSGNPSASTPTFSPVAGSFAAPQTVTITSGTSGATICYTVDGSTPTANGAGTCTNGSTYSTPVTVGTAGVSNTVTLKALASKSGFSDSTVASGAYTIQYAATPTISPASGAYIAQQSVTLSCSTGSSTIYYTTDGSTPTTGSTAYSGAFNSASSGTQTIKALCTATGYGNSSVASATYEIAPADVPIVSDNFSTYYDANIAGGRAQQPILDTVTTQGKWHSVGTVGMTGISEIPDNNAIAPVRTAVQTPFSSGYAYAGGSNNHLALAAYTGRTGFSANQYAKAYVVSVGTGKAGVCVRCDTATFTGYYVVANSTNSSFSSITLSKVVNGTDTTIVNSSGITINSGSLLELRVVGNQIQVLLNGSTPSGMSAVYTDNSITNGVPGIASYGGGFGSDWSAGNIGVADATSAGSYTAHYDTYSDTFNSAAWTASWPWVIAAVPYTPSCDVTGGPCGVWSGAVGPVLRDGTNYAVGLLATALNSTMVYRGAEFGSNQWQKYKVVPDPHDTRFNNWFTPLQHQTWVPGTLNGQCAAADLATKKHCYDSVSYYPGVETTLNLVNSFGPTVACGVKLEYICTPFMHITKVTPAASPKNEVVTVAGSFYTPRSGDEIYVEYVAPHLRVACKGHGPEQNRQSNHTYAQHEYMTFQGDLYHAATGGTTAASAPQFTYLFSPLPAPTVTTVGGAAGIYDYVVVWYEGASMVGASTAQSTTTGPTTLSGSTYNVIHTDVLMNSNATTCKVYRYNPTGGGNATSEGFIGTVTCGTNFNDTGMAGDGVVRPDTRASGAMTMDGSVKWEYMGVPCPTSDRFSWVIEAADTDLAGASGKPALWYGSANNTPFFYDWSAGTATSNSACLDFGICENTVQPITQIWW